MSPPFSRSLRSMSIHIRLIGKFWRHVLTSHHRPTREQVFPTSHVSCRKILAFMAKTFSTHDIHYGLRDTFLWSSKNCKRVFLHTFAHWKLHIFADFRQQEDHMRFKGWYTNKLREWRIERIFRALHSISRMVQSTIQLSSRIFHMFKGMVVFLGSSIKLVNARQITSAV